MRVEVEKVLNLPRRAITAGGTGTVGEPSIAQHGDQILFTGNWYVARSTNGGRTWQGFDPVPGHVVGIRDSDTRRWVLVPTVNGKAGHTKWGDYLTCRKRSPDDGGWIATGYTLQGELEEDSVRPFAVRFSAR